MLSSQKNAIEGNLCNSNSDNISTEQILSAYMKESWDSASLKLIRIDSLGSVTTVLRQQSL